MARTATPEFLRARQLQPHRAAGRNCQMPDDVLDQHLLLGAKATTDSRLDDPDTANRQVQQGGDHASHVKRHLGRRANDEPLVGIPPANGDVGLDRDLLHLMYVVGVLENTVGAGKTGLDIAELGLDVMHRIPGSGINTNRIALVMNDWRAGLYGFNFVKYGRQHLILDLDQLEGSFGDFKGIGRHGSHPISNVANLVVEADLVVRRRVRVGLASRRILDALDVLVVDDCPDTGQGERLCIIDGDDTRMGMGACQQFCV